MSTATLTVDDSLTTTHLLCGAGGDTQGFHEAGFTPVLAANHSKVCIDTHSANFPNTEHLVADVSNIDFRRLPRTRGLWASPVCTEISPAGGRKRDKSPDQLALMEYGGVDDATWERTRTTAYEVLRAVEICGYDFVACENVIEFATDWPLFTWWVGAMGILGYEATVTCVSSAHIGDDSDDLAPQWRDRFYVVFTRRGIPKPDLEPRPVAFCAQCDADVEAVQWWKDPRKSRVGEHLIGKYRAQYLYRCPAHDSSRPVIVEPYVRSAASAIDWDNPGKRIGDRKRPLAENTVKRIRTGMELFAGPPLLVPCGGGWAEPPMSALHEPMRTRIANPRGFEALVTPGAFIAELRRNGTARSVGEPLATIAAGGTHHALVMPYYRTGVAKPAGDPFDTFTVKDRFAVVSTGDLMRDINDAYLRMVQPRESLRGQRFPDYYQVLGNKGQQTAQAGNAVSVNVAKWIGLRTRAALDRTAAAA